MDMTRLIRMESMRLSLACIKDSYHIEKKSFSEPVERIVSIIFIPLRTEEFKELDEVALARERIAFCSGSFKVIAK